VRTNTVYRSGVGIQAGSHAWIDQNLVHNNGIGIEVHVWEYPWITPHATVTANRVFASTTSASSAVATRTR